MGASRLRSEHLVRRCDCAEVEKARQACALAAEKGFAGSTCTAELSQPVLLCNKIDFGAGSKLGCRPAKGSMLH